MPHQATRFCINQNSVDSAAESLAFIGLQSRRASAGVDQLDVLGRIRQQKREAVARRKTVGGERSASVLDALVERLERNSGTVDNQAVRCV